MFIQICIINFSLNQCKFLFSISMIGAGFNFINYNILNFINVDFTNSTTFFFASFINMIDFNIFHSTNCTFIKTNSSIIRAFVYWKF